MTFYSDRGCWNISLVKHMSLHGRDLTGTVKRTFWYLFTYDQELKKNDTRQLLETKGPSTLCSAKATVEKRNLIACACRTGTNNVSSTFSTIFDKITHDCAIDATRKRKITNDAITNNENNKVTVFRLFGKSDYSNSINHNDALGLLIALNVYHATERQRTPE